MALRRGSTTIQVMNATTLPLSTGPMHVRTAGEGEPILFLHGWPFHGLSWRGAVELLARDHRCVVPDLPGTGRTPWSADTDFTTTGIARAVLALADALELPRFALVAHDTGATAARVVAATAPARVSALVLTNTEIPGHRPPWIPTFTRTSRLPGARALFRAVLGSPRLRRTGLAYGECFADRARIDPELYSDFVLPLLESPARIDGYLRYLRGIDWALVDGLAELHRTIAADVAIVWGADDRTFPLARARPSFESFPKLREVVAVPGAKFLVHHEHPEVIASTVRALLAGASRRAS